MEITKVWMKISNSLWLVPSIYSVFSLACVIVFHTTDEWIVFDSKPRLPDILIIKEEIAMGLYSSLVTAILTMTTISFSVIMVVLTTYSSQFSPRTLQDFMQSKMTRHVLGVFCFGFIFALVNLVLVGKHDTIIGPILMVVIAIICLAFFIYFIHHSAKWLQVNSLMGIIQNDSAQVFEKTYAKKTFGEHYHWDGKEIDHIKQQPSNHFLAIHSGYVQKIDWASIVQWAKTNQCVIDVRVQVGDYVIKDFPLLYVYSSALPNDWMNIENYIVIGSERSDLEDIEFVIQKLVEIAVKAVSPSINDPDTAIDSINRIGAMLSELGKVYKEIRYLTDEKNKLRVIKEMKYFDDYLYKSFSQIVHYGKNDVTILYTLLEALYKIAQASEDNFIRRKIWAFHIYIVQTIDWNSLQHIDKRRLEAIIQQLQFACGK